MIIIIIIIVLIIIVIIISSLLLFYEWAIINYVTIFDSFEFTLIVPDLNFDFILSLDIADLRCQSYIQALQSEAHQALNEYVKVTHRRDSTRFTKLFIALSMLRSINANVVAGLFFKPVIGTVSMNELLLEMFYGK